MTLLGVLASVGALIAWTFGDFSIQRAVRKIGNLPALFFIGITGSIALFPFVYNQLSLLFSESNHVIFLSIASIVIFFGAVVEFQALKQGKLAIIEPIMGFELPFTIGLAIIFLNEQFSLLQLFLMVTTFIGIILTVTIFPSTIHIHKRKFEKGILFACSGALLMGSVNFLVGVGSELTSPLVTIWFTNIVFSLIAFIVLLQQGRIQTMIQKVKQFPKDTGRMVVFDNLAWIFFAIATSIIPISLATTISESYIACAVLLGVYVNHEKIKIHQKVGIAIAVVSIVFLSLSTI